MKNIKFDHTKEKLSEAIGMTEDEFTTVIDKCSSCSKRLVNEWKSESELSEELSKTCTEKELLFLTTLFIVDKTKQAVIEAKMKSLTDLLGKIFDKEPSSPFDDKPSQKTDEKPN